MGQGLLDNGTLYVAVLNEDGSGAWLPLRHAERPLTEENGFASQGDVLIHTRLAADLLGATKMDRPEDIQQNPVDHKIYGTFTWDIFILCGDPNDESTYFAGYPKDNVSPVACPDNVNFDAAGNLWISTDGQPGALDLVDGLFVVPTEGDQRGNTQQFLSVVAGADCASFEFTTDNRNLIVAVQHPGEGGTFEEPVSIWPHDGTEVARPAVIQVWALNGGKIGQS